MRFPFCRPPNSSRQAQLSTKGRSARAQLRAQGSKETTPRLGSAVCQYSLSPLATSLPKLLQQAAARKTEVTFPQITTKDRTLLTLYLFDPLAVAELKEKEMESRTEMLKPIIFRKLCHWKPL